jgi:hypothetical protein
MRSHHLTVPGLCERDHELFDVDIWVGHDTQKRFWALDSGMARASIGVGVWLLNGKRARETSSRAYTELDTLVAYVISRKHSISTHGKRITWNQQTFFGDDTFE